MSMISMFSASSSTTTFTQDLNRSNFSILEAEDVEPWKYVFVDSLRNVSSVFITDKNLLS